MELFPFDSENFNENLIKLYQEIFNSVIGFFKRSYKKVITGSNDAISERTTQKKEMDTCQKKQSEIEGSSLI